MLACQDNQDCLDSLDVKTGEIVLTVPLCYAHCIKTGEIVLMLHAHCVKTGEAVSILPVSCVKTGEIVLILHACCVKLPVSQQSHDLLLVGHLTSMVSSCLVCGLIVYK